LKCSEITFSSMYEVLECYSNDIVSRAPALEFAHEVGVVE
jgi:hypothetical protein